jgi:hypothetical protein
MLLHRDGDSDFVIESPGPSATTAGGWSGVDRRVIGGCPN